MASGWYWAATALELDVFRGEARSRRLAQKVTDDERRVRQAVHAFALTL